MGEAELIQHLDAIARVASRVKYKIFPIPKNMIAARENFPKLTPKEYFAWEEKQLNKHEYIEGEIYAMSGGSVNGEWVITNYKDGDTIELKSINLSFAIAQIYQGLTLTMETEQI